MAQAMSHLCAFEVQCSQAHSCFIRLGTDFVNSIELVDHGRSSSSSKLFGQGGNPLGKFLDLKLCLYRERSETKS